MSVTVEGIDGAVRIGDRLRPKRSRTGRIWRVRGESREGSGVALRLEPEGDDVGPARNRRTGKWQGGVRGVWRSIEELAGWERVLTAEHGTAELWPDCPLCGEPASSAITNVETRHVSGEMRVTARSGGTTTWECNRHPISQPPVYFTVDGVQVGAPAPDYTIRGM